MRVSNDMKYIHDMLAKFDAKLEEVHDELVEMRIQTAGRIPEFEALKKKVAELENQMVPVQKRINMIHGIIAFITFAVGALEAYSRFFSK